MIKVLSLFDGISCARVALEQAGFLVELYYASEIDKYAIQISKRNWPDTKHLGSVSDFHYSEGNSIRFDLLIGGSPCQDLSIAKKNRRGLSGDRSGLFWEYVRILKEAKPKWFILENVASMPKESKAAITEALGVEPIMIDAGLVSAQQRKRLFWTNIPNVTQPADRGIFLKDIIENGYAPEEKSLSITASYGKKNEQNYFKKSEGQMIAENDVVYQYRRTYWRETKGGKVPTLTANMGTGGHNVPFIKVPEATKKGYAIAYPGDSVDMRFPNSKTRRGRVGNKAKNIMTSQSIGVFDGKGIRKLLPVECERLQSLPDGYTEGVSNTQRYKCLGNAFNVDVVAHILSFIP